MSALDEILTCTDRPKYCDICFVNDGTPCKLDRAAAELAQLRFKIESVENANRTLRVENNHIRSMWKETIDNNRLALAERDKAIAEARKVIFEYKGIGIWNWNTNKTNYPADYYLSTYPAAPVIVENCTLYNNDVPGVEPIKKP